MESRRRKPCVSHCTQLARHRAVADLPSGVTSRQETLLLDVYDVLQTPDVPVAGVVRPLDAARVPSSSDTVPNLLYVGRDSATLALLERVAASESCGIASVSNGIGALRLMRGGGYDVVVTQSDLPVEADLAFLDEANGISPGMRVILLVAGSPQDRIVDVLRSHAFACFGEPFAAGDFEEAVRRAIKTEHWRDGIEVVSASNTWLTLRASSRPMTADRIVQFVDELQSDVPSSERAALLRAFREILLNAMEHGAGFDAGTTVDVSIVRGRGAVIYHFRDPGAGFDPENLAHSATSNPMSDPIAHMAVRETQGMRPGGFGILMASQLVDEVIFNEKGNEVLLIKYLERSTDDDDV